MNDNHHFKPYHWERINRKRHNNPFKTLKTHENRVQKVKSRDAKRRKALKEAGIDYEFDGYVSHTECQHVCNLLYAVGQLPSYFLCSLSAGCCAVLCSFCSGQYEEAQS